MVQTNLLGRKFQSKMDKSEFTCVAVYVTGGQLLLVGETQRGSLVELNTSQAQLMAAPRAAAPESLLGVV